MILIVDGNNTAYRSDSVLEMNWKTKRTSAIFGMLTTLRSVMNRVDPSSVIVVWDVGGSKYRRGLFSQYKKKRAESRDEEKFLNFIEQAETLRQRFLPLLGVKQLWKKGVEADDMIYRAAKYYEGKGEEVLIMSGDSDLYQLVSKSVTIFSAGRKSDQFIKPSNFSRVTKGLNPSQHLSYKILVGDSTDGIPGVPGFGDITARKALAKFDSAEGVVENFDEVVRLIPRVKTFCTLGQARTTVALNRKLIDLSVPNTRKRITAVTKRITPGSWDPKEFRNLCAEFGFVFIMSNFMDWIVPFRDAR